MADLADSNSTSIFDNTLVELRASDNTVIGNVADSIKTNVTNAAGASAVNIQDGGNSITVDATALPLPSGASTSTLQTTGNSSLSSIDSKTPALGQALAAASTPVVLTAAQLNTLTPLTSVTVTQATGTNLHTVVDSSALPTGAATSANQTNGSQKTQVVDGSGTVQGPMQTLSGTNYAPVVLAASVISGSAIAAQSVQIAGSDGTNARTIATDTTGKLNINNISGVVSLPTGAATEASLAKLTLTQGSTTSGQSGPLIQGAVTTTAPTYTTAKTAPLSLDTSGNLRTAPTVQNPSLLSNQMYSMGVVRNSAAADTDNNIVLLRNPNGSGKTVYIVSIVCNNVTTNVTTIFKIFTNPTVTLNGTAVTPDSRFIGNGAAAAITLINTLPTATLPTVSLVAITAGQNSAGVSLIHPYTIGIVANNSLVITASPSSNNRSVSITINWIEV